MNKKEKKHNGLIPVILLGVIPILLLILQSTGIPIPSEFISNIGAYCSFSVLTIILVMYALEKGGKK